MTQAGISKLLARLGFRRRATTSYIQSPDPMFALKRRAISQAFAAALHEPERVAILFQDELSYWHMPEGGRAWSDAAQPYHQRAPGENKLTRIGGAVDGRTGQLLYIQGDKFGCRQMRRLYRNIRKHFSQPMIYVVQDNLPSVHKHPTVLRQAAKLDIIPLFLPTYASWLNPIEKLWRWLRQHVLIAHPFAHSLSALRAAAADFLDQFADGSSALLRYIGLLPD